MKPADVKRHVASLACLFRHPVSALARKRTLFVISHMRSYSSLLCHILGSHPEISGYAESHLPYGSACDLVRLRGFVIWSTAGRLKGRFVLDKILHDGHRISTSILNRRDLDVIFLLREPERSIESLVAMGRRHVQLRRLMDPDTAAGYYVRRLATLADYATGLRQKALFVASERLMDRTGTILARTAGHLHLDPSLSEAYGLFRFTGHFGYGDPSGAITRGRICRDFFTQDPVSIPKDILMRAREAYTECKQVLTQNCRCV